MPKLTAEQVTNLYLYGQDTTPVDKVDANLIRPKNTTPIEVSVDGNEFMRTGPGRFATPVLWEVVQRFFDQNIILAAGTYNETQMRAATGVSGSALSFIQQYNYDDGTDDYIERTYIWNTGAFEIDDSARFIVAADGSRYIEHFAVIPFSDNKSSNGYALDNFDFEGGNEFTDLANVPLEKRVDPFGIGRKVNLEITNVTHFTTYRASDFIADEAIHSATNISMLNPLNILRLGTGGFQLTQKMFESGITRFLDNQNRPIIYGTDNDQSLSAENLSGVPLTIQAPLLSNYLGNGLVILGGKGEDNIKGSIYSDYIEGNFGIDTIDGNAGDDIIHGGAAADTINGGGDNDALFGGDGVDTLYGDNGSDILKGGAGNDHLYAGQDTDTLIGGTGDDTYYFKKGDGINFIEDTGNGDILVINTVTIDSDTVIKSVLAGATVYLDEQDNRYTLSDDGLLVIDISGGNGEDRVIIKDFESSDFGITLTEGSASLGDIYSGDAGNNYMQDRPNTSVYGGDGQDMVHGTSTYYAGTDYLELKGGAGDDWINANPGKKVVYGGDNDDYIAGLFDNSIAYGGEGADILTANTTNSFQLDGFSLPGDADLIWQDFRYGLAHIAPTGTLGHFTFSGASLLGGDWQYRFTIEPHPTQALGSLSKLEYKRSGTNWDNVGAQIKMPYALSTGVVLDGGEGIDTLIGSTSNDILFGGKGNFKDTLLGLEGSDILSGGAGKDTLEGNGGEDVLYGGAGIDELRGGAGDDIVYGGSEGDYIEGDDVFTTSGNSGNDLLYGEAGEDTLIGQGGDDRLYGGIDKDDLFGNGGHDILYGGAGNDHLEGDDINFLDKDGGNDMLYGGAGDDTLLGGSGDDHLYGGSGKDDLLGGQGDDILDGGTGEGDALQGEEGNDVYLFSVGDGNTTINNYDTSAGHQDTLQFNASSADVSAKRLDLDLLLTVASTGEVITVQNHFLDNQYALNTIQFSDATSWDEDTIKTLVFQGTQGDDYIAGYATDDVISGFDGNDDLHGGGGNDTIQGGTGNDFLEGGIGNDTYLFNLGDGHDVINENVNTPAVVFNTHANGIDTLVFGQHINPAHLTAQRGIDLNNNDLILHIDNDNSITVQGWFDANVTTGGQFLSPRKIEFVEFSGGRRADVNQIEQLLSGIPLNFAPVISGSIDEQQLDFDEAIDFTIPTDTFVDLEGDELTLTATLADGSDLPDWLNFDSQTGQFSGLPPESAPSQQDIKIIATDTGGLSTAPVSFSFSIAPEIKLGDEFIISTDYSTPSITALENGGSFVQWTNYNGIAGQMYSKDGQPFGGQISIQEDGDHISTAALTDGGVVIVWAHTEPDPENNGIFGQRYSDAGIAMGDKFLISADGDHYFDDHLGDIANSEGGDLGGTGPGGPLLQRASSPIIASNADGFLVTWTERQSQQNFMDANETHIQYHNFSRWYGVSSETLSPGLISLPEARTAVFNDFYGSGFEAYGYYDELADQQLFARDGGSFILLNWGIFAVGDSGFINHGLRASNIEISGYYLDISTNELGIVDRYSNQRDSEFAITALADGGHVIVWQGTGSVGTGSQQGVYAQRYDSAGAELGTKIKVSSDGGQPSVLSLSDGSFIIEWTGANNSFGQRYDLDGNLVERKFQISSSSLENAEGDPILFGGTAELVETRPGEIFVTWQGVNANNYDRDVVGKRLSYTYLGSHNTAPELSQAISDQSSNEDALLTFTLPADTFTDSDVGDSLTFTVSLADGGILPSWLSFDAISQTFSGTPDNDQIGLLELKVTATDNDGLIVSDTFALTINNVNDAPTISLALLDQTVNEDNVFNFTLPANTFNDVDAGDSVALSAALADGSALPTWLSFDAITQTFSGTPDNDQVGLLELKVTATDNDGLTVSDTFNLTVNNINDAPIVNGTLVDQIADEDSLFSYQLPVDTFTDIDAGDNLTLSATLADGSVLPSWLSFDALTQTFSGTPPLDASGGYEFKVTATDSGSLAVDTSFSLIINDVTTGDTGNDRLRVRGDHQTINSGDGNDSAVAIGDYNQVNGGEGRDRVRAYGSHNTVNGGTGNDTAVVIGHNSTVNGGDGNDRIGARGNNNTFNGGDGNDSIRAYSNNGIFNGDAGNDTLYANGDNNTLNGGEGNDRLFVRATTATNTTFNGGAGDDRITGSQNNDTYLFTTGDGHDTLLELGHEIGGTDTLKFGQGIEADDLWFERAANDLEITIYNSDDSVTIKDWYSDDNHKIDTIKLSDGQALMNNQLDQLVQAMATFGVPAAGTSELTGQIKDEIAPVIAASWG